MSSINKVILIGYVGNPPKTHHTKDQKMIVNVSIATSEKWKNKQGEPQERTEWHSLVFYNRLAELAATYIVKKGQQIYVEGKLQTDKFTDKNDNERQITKTIVTHLQVLSKIEKSQKENITPPIGDDFKDDIIDF